MPLIPLVVLLFCFPSTARRASWLAYYRLCVQASVCPASQAGSRTFSSKASTRLTSVLPCTCRRPKPTITSRAPLQPCTSFLSVTAQQSLTPAAALPLEAARVVTHHTWHTTNVQFPPVPEANKQALGT